jgi:hypothetical protein
MKVFSIVLILLIAGLMPAAFAQVTDSNLVGAVLDKSDAAVPNASVEVENNATGVKFTATTDATGHYRFNNLPVSTYNIKAGAPGFSTSQLRGIALELNKTATVNIKLEIGQVTSVVEVLGSSITLDTTTPQIQTIITEKDIVDLPIMENANSLYGALNVSLLGAGVASNGGVGQGTGPSVGGQRPMNNNFMIEGVDNNNKTVTGPLVYVPTEATSEFSLLENQFGAEFGHSTGGQFNTIVRGGTNSLHGSIYEYLQNRNLNAVDQQFARQGILSNPRFDQNKLGASVGGPILKNKLFYFGNFEYAPLGLASTLGAPILTPTAAGYALLDKMANISQFNYGILKKYATPAPTQSDQTPVNGVQIPIGILPIVGPNYVNFYTALASIDYNVSERDQIRGRYIYNRYDALDTAANLPAFWTTLPQRFHIFTASEFHTFGAHLTNEFRLGYNRFLQDYTVPDIKLQGLDVFPNIQIDNDLGIQIGPDSNAPQFTFQNTYQIVDNISWMRGRHSFKFGVDVRDSISPQHFIQRERGDYDWSTLEAYLHDIVPDNLAERNLGGTSYYGNQWATYLYGTDTWHISKNLTGYFGLRWERTTVPLTQKLQALNAISNVPGLIDFHAPKVANKNFAPRIGLAYAPGTSGNTVIRAGFGMGYDVIFDNVGSTAYPPQLSATADANNYPNIFKTPFLQNGGIFPKSVPAGAGLSQADARASTSSYLFDQKLPYSIQWNLGVSHVFKQDYTVEVRYLGTRGVHLLVQEQINKTNTPVTSTRNLPTYLAAPTQSQLDALTLTLPALQAISPRAPAFAAAGFTSNITAWPPIGNSTYHGLAAQLNRRFSHGFSLVSAYTWSHNIDDSTATHFSTILTPRRPQAFLNQTPEKATSALDRRQRLTLSWNWETPWYAHSSRWLAKNVLGNWRITGTYTGESGELATCQSGADANMNGDSAGDRCFINPNGNPLLGSDSTALKNSAGQTVAYLAKNPSAMFIKAQPGAYANGGRNTLQLPGINNFDLSFGKRLKFTESKGFEVRADFSNAFNHPQYTPGYVNSVRLTSQTSNKTFLLPNNSQFLQWSQNFPSNARGIQVAAKFTF